ncbi:MAG TPA: nitroreductase family protein [Candidatus Dormibacteraeota bacterium]|nr:nitroreductase family protein [Candidatus Dormibacteraeota bacterium]
MTQLDRARSDVDRRPLDVIRPLLRTRQVREFTDEPVPAAVVDAIVDAGRWSGSSQNDQPWRFVVIRDVRTLRRLHEAGLPQTRALGTATAAVAIAVPRDTDRALSYAYDEGRAAERMLVAATMLEVGAGITWIRRDVDAVVREALGLPPDRLVRTILAIGHPTPAALRPKSPPGQARLPREQVVFEERWKPSRSA